MANENFNERVLFQLPSDYTCERGVDDNGDAYFKIQKGKYINDDGETEYEFCCFVSLLEYDPNDLDNAADGVIEFDKETENSRILELSDTPKVYMKSLCKTFSIFGKPIIIFELSGQIRLSDCSLLKLETRKAWSDDETINELSIIQNFLCVFSSVFIDGRKLPLDIFSAAEIYEYLKIIVSPEAQDISPKIQFKFNLNGEERTHEFHYEGKKQSFEHTDSDEQVNQKLKATTSCGIWFMLEKIVSMCKNTSYFTEDEIEIIEDGLTFHESLISEVLQRDSEMYEAALSSNKIASNAIMSIATDNGKAAISIFENALDKWIPPCFEKAFTLIALFFDIPYAPSNSLPIEEKREIMQDCRGFVNSMQLAIAMADIGVQYTAPDYCDADSVSVTHTRNNTVVAINANERNKGQANTSTNDKGANDDTIDDVQPTEKSYEGFTVIKLDSPNVRVNGKTLHDFLGKDDIEKIVISGDFKKIDAFAFFGAKKLKSVIVSEGVTHIGNDCFSCCEKLEEILLPTTLMNIGAKAFTCCVSLKEISIPGHVTTIGAGAFECCQNLKKVVLPKSIFSISGKWKLTPDNIAFYLTKDSVAEGFVKKNYKNAEIHYI